LLDLQGWTGSDASRRARPAPEVNREKRSIGRRSPQSGVVDAGSPRNRPEGRSVLIGKRGAATTALSTAEADRIEIRGRDLAADLMGSASFTAFFFFLTTGRMPTEAQRFFLDLALIAIAEHGLTPSVQAARMTYAADPAALQGAVAAGVLGCGTVILGAAREAFAAQTSLIKERLLSGTALASDETGLRVGKANWWLWVFHHGDSAAFVADAHRSKAVVETFLGAWRPDVWLSDRLGSQTGWARRDHQVCLAHLIRDVQYVVDQGDGVFAPALKGLLKRACAIGRRRADLADATLKSYLADLERRLNRLLALEPAHAAGRKLQKTIKAIRGNLFVFMTNREIEATNNGSERALRPGAVYRKITNGFRSEWGAKFYADLRSVIETGRRRSVRALDAIRLTLQGHPLPHAA